MRRTFPVVAAVSFALTVAVGCGEDPPDNDEWDVGADADAGSDVAEPEPDVADTGDDTGDTAPPEDTAMDTGMDTGTDTGVDTGTDTGIDTGMDTGMDTGTDTGTDATDGGMDATDATDATDTTDVSDVSDTGGELNRDALPMTFGAGSFIKEFYIDADQQTRNNRASGDPRCCFNVQIQGTDKNYDSEQDNALADFLGNIGSLAGFGIGDVNSNVNQGIREGDFIYLFEYKNWDSSNWQNDSSIDMFAHPGDNSNTPWTQTEWNQVEMGNGTFEILPKSYNANGTPKSEFNTVKTTPDGSGADLTADDGTFNLVLNLGSGLTTTFTVERAELTADIPSNADVTNGGEVAMQNGKLGGAIAKGDMYTAINQAASSCMCYDMTMDKMIEKQSAETYQCDTKASCSCSGTVGQLEQFCSTLRQSVSNATDVNLNNASPDNDALSFGASFSAAKAKIDGVAP